jgi:YegS/Rv2252/BmrU family lipid kinase
LHQVLGRVVECRFTSGPGDGTRHARHVLQSGCDWVIVAGGDGTINEVVNGYFQDGRNTRTDCPLSFLPLGSGNDWVRTLGVPPSVPDAVEALARTSVRFVDVGLARFAGVTGSTEQRVFVNFAEAGVGAALVRRLNKRRARPNLPFYLLSTLLTALSYKARPLELRFDGTAPVSSGALLSLIVANGRFFGAGMQCAPMARPDDGMLDVVTIGDFGKLELIVKIRKLVRGDHLSEAKVTHRPACYLETSSPHPVFLELDGDMVGSLPAEFTILPRSLQVRC